MIKTIIIWIDELETYLNKKGYTFLCNYQDQFIFKFNDSLKSTEIMKEKSLLDLIKTLNIEDFREYWDDIYLKETMKDFVMYWMAKNEGWKKERWQTEKIFDVWQRYRTFLKNWKKFNKNLNTKNWVWSQLD